MPKNSGLRKCFLFVSIELTYLLTHSMKQSPFWEANQFSGRQEIHAFYGSRRFITAFTSASHLSLTWAR